MNASLHTTFADLAGALDRIAVQMSEPCWGDVVEHSGNPRLRFAMDAIFVGDVSLAEPLSAVKRWVEKIDAYEARERKHRPYMACMSRAVLCREVLAAIAEFERTL